MPIEVETIPGPTHIASYLVNGDGSSLTEEEISQADQWLADVSNGEGWRVVATEGDEYFSRKYGQTVTYVLHRNNQQ